ncbi:MAG: hypothetical protein AMXMBFR47_43060, partial [Planctomycetota bacterium]
MQPTRSHCYQPCRTLARTRILLAWLTASCAWTGASGASAATITWTGGAGTGSWHNPANWDLGRVPAAGDDVVIPDMTPDVTVSFSSTSTSINSLTSGELVSVSGGFLSIAGTSVLDAGMTLTNGEIGGTGTLTVNGPF